MNIPIAKKGLSCTLALVLVGALLFVCLPQKKAAFADDVPADIQQRIEQTAKDYNEASEKVESLEKQIEDNTARIDELEVAIPTQQSKATGATKALYKMQNEGYSLLNLVLDAGSLSDFITTLDYIDSIQQANMNEISRLKYMKTELEDTKASLDTAMADAESEKAKAETAMQEAQEAREEFQRQAEAAAKAQAAAAAEAAAKAQAEADAAAAAHPADESLDMPEPVTPQTTGGSDQVDWGTDKTAFVNEWTPRIDAYLAGSPLAGQGKTFAEAAWNYGVDPRWSPAISNTESSKGAICFLSHNAWGWGSSSWSSWEEAIDAHVRGLSRGYGYSISVAAAQKYCPPNWQHWYNSTLAQMNMI